LARLAIDQPGEWAARATTLPEHVRTAVNQRAATLRQRTTTTEGSPTP
jgi:hypothetical protein